MKLVTCQPNLHHTQLTLRVWDTDQPMVGCVVSETIPYSTRREALDCLRFTYGPLFSLDHNGFTELKD